MIIAKKKSAIAWPIINLHKRVFGKLRSQQQFTVRCGQVVCNVAAYLNALGFKNSTRKMPVLNCLLFFFFLN